MRQKHLLDLIVLAYPPVRWFTDAVTQGAGGVMQLLAFVALNVGAMAALVLLAGSAYQRLAVKQSEAFARMNAKAARRRPAWSAFAADGALPPRTARDRHCADLCHEQPDPGRDIPCLIAAAMLAGGSGSPRQR